MKKIIVLLALTLFVGITSVFTQTSGFNYQAIIRNVDSEPLVEQNIALRIGIIQGTPSGTEAYSETHNVATNSFGLVNVTIGQGTPTNGTFLDIDWSDYPYFMNIAVDIQGGTNFIDIGTTQLFAVPYAFYALNSEGPESLWQTNGENIFFETGNVAIGKNEPIGRFEVKGAPDASAEDPLFQVINKLGDTVFAVYENGVQVYINDNPAKGNIGGFAVSGRAVTKEPGYDYLTITPDSTRIYVNSEPGKGNIGGFAVSGRAVTKGEENNFLDLTPDNYFIGHRSGINTDTGLYNVFIGYESGYSNTGGISNVFVGHESGYSNTIGAYNVFLGNETGYSNTIGESNVIIGDGAGEFNSEGSYNIFIGDWSGRSNEIGEANVFLGAEAGYENISGSYNVAIGSEAGRLNQIGENNVLVGIEAGYSNLSSDNVMIGGGAGFTNTTGEANLFVGSYCGTYNETGSYNVFLGNYSGENHTIGDENIFIGNESGYFHDNGEGNTIIGSNAGFSNETGNYNVFIGYDAGYDELGSNKLYIENSGSDSSDALIFGNFDEDWLRVNYRLGVGRNPYSNELEVEGDASKDVPGEWLANSDKRIKTDIQNIESAFETILKLRPIKYKYTQEWMKKHSKIEDKFYYNFIAQEFQEVFPESVKGSGEYLEGDKEEILQIDTYNAQIVTIKAVQELILISQKQAEEIEKLKSMNMKLTNSINDIEEENKQLKAEIGKIKSSTRLELSNK